MPRSFAPETGIRINLPKAKIGPPVANQGGGAPGLPRPKSAPTGVSVPRQRHDDVKKPIPAPGVMPAPIGQATSPSQVKPTPAPGQPGTGEPVQPPGGPAVPQAFAQGFAKTKQEFVGPNGETVTQEAPVETGGLEAGAEAQQPPEPAPGEQPDPPVKSSPLGENSPIEKHLASAGAGMPRGAQHHLRQIGISTEGLSPQEAARQEQLAVRDFQRFGQYSGQDDPHAPAPPIRPGKSSFNPTTGQWIHPEGKASALDAFMRLRGR